MASKKTPAAEFSLFPHQLRPGDRVMVNGAEWEVAAPPAVYLAGKMQTVRLRKPGDPSVTDIQHMPAHERVTVRRDDRPRPGAGNRRGSLLLTAMAMACLPWPGVRPEIADAIEAGFSGWRGLGLLVDGIGRRGYDLELVVFEGQQWRATFSLPASRTR